jgi:hypothetical protein
MRFVLEQLPIYTLIGTIALLSVSLGSAAEQHCLDGMPDLLANGPDSEVDPRSTAPTYLDIKVPPSTPQSWSPVPGHTFESVGYSPEKPEHLLGMHIKGFRKDGEAVTSFEGRVLWIGPSSNGAKNVKAVLVTERGQRQVIQLSGAKNVEMLHEPPSSTSPWKPTPILDGLRTVTAAKKLPVRHWAEGAPPPKLERQSDGTILVPASTWMIEGRLVESEATAYRPSPRKTAEAVGLHAASAEGYEIENAILPGNSWHSYIVKKGGNRYLLKIFDPSKLDARSWEGAVESVALIISHERAMQRRHPEHSRFVPQDVASPWLGLHGVMLYKFGAPSKP